MVINLGDIGDPALGLDFTLPARSPPETIAGMRKLDDEDEVGSSACISLAGGIVQ